MPTYLFLMPIELCLRGAVRTSALLRSEVLTFALLLCRRNALHRKSAVLVFFLHQDTFLLNPCISSGNLKFQVAMLLGDYLTEEKKNKAI